MNTVEREILRLEREQAKSFNRRDLDAILTQFTPGFVGFSSTRHGRISGRAALKKTFLHYLAQSPSVRYRVAEVKVQVFDGAAVASFYWSVQWSAKHKVEGRGSHVFVNRGGRWQIVHEHFSRAH